MWRRRANCPAKLSARSTWEVDPRTRLQCLSDAAGAPWLGNSERVACAGRFQGPGIAPVRRSGGAQRDFHVLGLVSPAWVSRGVHHPWSISERRSPCAARSQGDLASRPIPPAPERDRTASGRISTSPSFWPARGRAEQTGEQPDHPNNQHSYCPYQQHDQKRRDETEGQSNLDQPTCQIGTGRWCARPTEHRAGGWFWDTLLRLVSGFVGSRGIDQGVLYDEILDCFWSSKTYYSQSQIRPLGCQFKQAMVTSVAPPHI